MRSKLKLLILVLLLLSGLVLINCGNRHASEINTFIHERSVLAVQMAAKVDASPNEAGVTEARKIFDSKKDALSAKRDALKKADLSFDSVQQIWGAERDDDNLFKSVRDKHVMELFGTQYDKLVTDFGHETGWRSP